MKNVLSKLTAVIFFICVSQLALGQATHMQKDSLMAKEILKRSEINTAKTVSLNANGLKLDLTQKEILLIAKNVLNSTYGKSQIRKQKPFHIVKVEKYWIIWGSLKKNTRGGVFEIIINSENSCVEYLSHGK